MQIFSPENIFFDHKVLFAKTYAGVPKNEPVLYLNSMHCLALGLNQGHFCNTFGIHPARASPLTMKIEKEKEIETVEEISQSKTL